MFKTLRDAFRIKDLRKKLLYTFMMLVVVRFGSELPIPGVNTSYFADFFAKQSGDAFGFFNAMTGGSFTSMSVFALSITPYITSSIIMQLMTIAIPKLEEMQKDGEDGRKKILEYTRYVTVGLALIESTAMAVGFGGQPIATAKRICRLLMMAQPMLSIVLPTVKIMLISAPAICTSFPRLIIRPAAGITAITAISTFPSFCKKSKLMDSFFFSDFGSGAEFSRLSDGSVCVFCSSFRFSLDVSVKSTLFPASTCPG